MILKQLLKAVIAGSAAVGSYCSYKYNEDVGIIWQGGIQDPVLEFLRWVKDTSGEFRELAQDSLVRCCRNISQKEWFSLVNGSRLIVALANSKTPSLHDLGTKLLSSMYASSADIVFLRENCSWYTLVGLARLPETDVTKWFPMPGHVGVETDSLDGVVQKRTEDIVRLQVSALPKSGDACSLRLYHQMIGNLLPDEPHVFLLQEFCEENMFGSRQVQEPSADDLSLSLDILRRYSQTLTPESAVPDDLLKILRAVMFLHRNDVKTLEVCGNILANFSVHGRFHEQIVHEGFLPLLVHWRLGDCVSLDVIADRILHNMDTMHGSCSLPDGVHLLHPTNRAHEKDMLVDVVFIHGVWGSPFYTWRQNDACKKANSNGECLYTHCWPKSWLAGDVPTVRILTLQYDSYVSSWSQTCSYGAQNQGMKQLALDIGRKLRSCGVGQKPIVWVTHSMGGLLVKQLLIEAMDELMVYENSTVEADLGPLLLATQGIAFYSTPHLGSPIATTCNYVKFLLYPSVQASELMENSRLLTEMHACFLRLMNVYGIECLSFCEACSTKLPYVKMKVNIVPQRSCDVGYGKVVICNADHLGICKPVDRTDICYTETFDLISRVLARAC